MSSKFINKKSLKQYFIYPSSLKKREKVDKNKDSWVDFVIPANKNKIDISNNIDEVIYKDY